MSGGHIGDEVMSCQGGGGGGEPGMGGIGMGIPLDPATPPYLWLMRRKGLLCPFSDIA